LLDSWTLLGRPGLLDGIAPSGLARKLVTVIVFGVAGVAFIGLLFVTGGLTAEDRNRFRRVFSRGRQGAQGA
jgi:hypothetical protein